MMKRLSAVVSILVLTIFGCSDGSVSTRGPQGPEGPPGPVGQGFEVEATFNVDNNYSEQFFFSDYGAEALDTDIVLVYWLYGTDEQSGNGVWQQLPATTYFEDGQFQYAFDHTLDDVQLFLQGNIDFSTLGPGYTQEQIFWVAILPVDYVQANNIDTSNIKEVMEAVKNSGNLDRVSCRMPPTH